MSMLPLPSGDFFWEMYLRTYKAATRKLFVSIICQITTFFWFIWTWALDMSFCFALCLSVWCERNQHALWYAIALSGWQELTGALAPLLEEKKGNKISGADHIGQSISCVLCARVLLYIHHADFAISICESMTLCCVYLRSNIPQGCHFLLRETQKGYGSGRSLWIYVHGAFAFCWISMLIFILVAANLRKCDSMCIRIGSRSCWSISCV